MGQLTRLLAGRLAQAALVALMVGVLTFILVRSLPGDMAYRIAAGRYGYDLVDTAAALAVRQELGLDAPWIVALGNWLWQIVQLDLGVSLVSSQPVWEEVRHQLGHSFTLALAALMVSVLLGPPLGILAGLRPGGVADRLVLLFGVSFRSLPQFAIGLLLIVIFAVELRLLPAAGYGEPRHFILPALALGLGLAAVSSRVARNATLAVTASDYYQFGRLKGLSGPTLFRQHGLRNIAVPVVTYLGIQLIYLIEGVVIIETLFAWPGIGHALVHAIFARDVPMIQGTALVLGLGFVLLNTLVDILNHLIDPRGRAS